MNRFSSLASHFPSFDGIYSSRIRFVHLQREFVFVIASEMQTNRKKKTEWKRRNTEEKKKTAKTNENLSSDEKKMGEKNDESNPFISNFIRKMRIRMMLLYPIVSRGTYTVALFSENSKSNFLFYFFRNAINSALLPLTYSLNWWKIKHSSHMRKYTIRNKR